MEGKKYLLGHFNNTFVSGHNHAWVISEKGFESDHESEKEHGEIYRKVLREERERGNDSITLLSEN